MMYDDASRRAGMILNYCSDDDNYCSDGCYKNAYFNITYLPDIMFAVIPIFIMMMTFMVTAMMMMIMMIMVMVIAVLRR